MNVKLKVQADSKRPITLTASLSKLLQRVIVKHIDNYLEDNELLHENQFGFRRNRSTVHNLLNHVTQLAKMTRHTKKCKKKCNGHAVDTIRWDLRKAFDRVPHHLMLAAVQKAGIRGDYGRFVENFLEKRKQYVQVIREGSNPGIFSISIVLVMERSQSPY